MRVLIADDESLARARLNRLLRAIPDVELAGEVHDGPAVLARIAAGDVDVVLLDIQMPGISGVDAMQCWPTAGPLIVFVTAHADHAIAAFDGGAADYLLKPVAPDRLALALDRARVRLETRAVASPTPIPISAAVVHPPTTRAGPIAIDTRLGIIVLQPEQILAVSLDGVSTVLTTTRGRFHTERTLTELETALAGELRRVHRSALLRIASVQRFEPQDSGAYMALLQDGTGIPVSRAVARELRREWGLG